MVWVDREDLLVDLRNLTVLIGALLDAF